MPPSSANARGVRSIIVALSLTALLGAQELPPGNWSPYNHQQLESLLARLGENSPHYDPDHPPYAVFDWDNTSVFLDVEEAALVYQLLNTRFWATPEQLGQALRQGVPQRKLSPEFGSLDPEDLIVDILDSYGHLQDPAHRLNFATKVRFLYEALDSTFGRDVSYPWITYLYSGANTGQVRQLVGDAIRWQLDQPVGKVTWTSPASLPGRAGVVSVTWKNGLRLVPEMQQLQQTLRRHGFEVWICTASLEEVILEPACAPEFGYHNSPERVLGMRLQRDSSGHLLPLLQVNYPKTYGPGKSEVIRQQLLSRYGYGPALVAGDSEGDENMLSDFPDTQLSLIIDRHPRPTSLLARLLGQARSQRGREKARFLWQGRDETTGRFCR
jgi:hypothetical protein